MNALYGLVAFFCGIWAVCMVGFVLHARALRRRRDEALMGRFHYDEDDPL